MWNEKFAGRQRRSLCWMNTGYISSICVISLLFVMFSSRVSGLVSSFPVARRFLHSSIRGSRVLRSGAASTRAPALSRPLPQTVLSMSTYSNGDTVVSRCTSKVAISKPFLKTSILYDVEVTIYFTLRSSFWLLHTTHILYHHWLTQFFSSDFHLQIPDLCDVPYHTQRFLRHLKRTT